MMKREVAALLALLATAAAAASAQQDASGDRITTYTAVYDAHYKGKRVGTSEFSVARDESTGHYVFKSETRVKGLLRLVSPNPAIDRSEFVIDGGSIRPLAFGYEDGSRKGEDNFRIAFDWTKPEASVEREGGSRAFTLTPRALDRGSLQVALIRDVAGGVAPGPYTVVDDDGIQTYEFTEQEPGTVETGMGLIEARRFMQQRQGSSRQTVLSLAPSLEYVPVRIEQFRDGEVRTLFVLDSIDID